MSKAMTIGLAATVCLVAMANPLLAGSTNNEPVYVGIRSPDPEKETFGYRVGKVDDRDLILIGPARSIGKKSIDSEKRTVALRAIPVSNTRTDCLMVRVN